MSNLLTIHFFRDYTQNQEKIDYNKILEFFEVIPNFEIYYTDDAVEIEYTDKEFNFSYRYLITRKSRVNKIYKLNPVYANVNFLLEMPLLIPSFLAKEVFSLTQKICKVFELGYYNDAFDDVQNFNIVDLLVFFENQRTECIEQVGLNGKIKYKAEPLNYICRYQRSVDELNNYYKNEVTVNLCYPVIDSISGESGICYDWKIGTSVIFPPYVDFINIVDPEEGNFFVRKDSLFEIIEGYLAEVKNFLPDMYVIKDKKAIKVRKELKKIKKIVLDDKDFQTLNLSDCIEG